MSITTYNDVELLCIQLSLNNTMIIENYNGFTVYANKNYYLFINMIFLIIYEDRYFDYCNINNNIIENFIKNKKLQVQLFPNIYKSNIKNFDLINILSVQYCKYFTNIVNSKKIEKLYIDSFNYNRNIKDINLLKRLKNVIDDSCGVKLNKNIMNQINKLNKYNKNNKHNFCIHRAH